MVVSVAISVYHSNPHVFIHTQWLYSNMADGYFFIAQLRRVYSDYLHIFG